MNLNKRSQILSPSCILRWRRCGAAVLLLSGVGGVLLGCSGSGDTTDPVSLTPAQAFWAIRLDKHAVNLALTPPYDTVRLNPQILNAVGSPLTGDTGRVRYSFPDSSVTVDSMGLMTAHFVTQGTPLIASFTAQGVTLSDTVFVQVTAAAPSQLATFSLHPADGSPSKCEGFFNLGDVCTTLAVTAADINGTPVPLTDPISRHRIRFSSPLTEMAMSVQFFAQNTRNSTQRRGPTV